MRQAPFRRGQACALGALALVLAAALGGCGKDKVTNVIPTPRPSLYPLLVNPYAVLDALQTAYQLRDTTEIKALYDDNYVGSSIDQTDPLPAMLTFYKFDENQHIAKLAHTHIVNISLAKANSFVRFQDLADPPGWTTIDNPFTSLSISDSVSTWSVDFTSELTEFKFVPHTPDASSVTDTTWKIIRWTEVKH
jgi:hypothetical protein